MSGKYLSVMTEGGGTVPPRQPIFMIQPPPPQGLPIPGAQPPAALQQVPGAGQPSEEIEVVRKRSPKPTVAPDDALQITDSKGIKSGTYSRQKIQQAILAAKATGVDPYAYLARVMQESGFGTAAVRRPGRGAVYSAWAGVHQEQLDPGEVKQIDDLAQQTGLDRKLIEGAAVMRNKLRYGQQMAQKWGVEPTPAFLYQAHNGYGVITKEKAKSNKWHGVPIPEGGLNMAHTPLDGMRVAQLREDMARNPKIRAMIEGMAGR